MGLTLQNMRDQLRSHLGMDDLDIPDVDVDNFLNLSYWEITKKLNFREVEQYIDITLGIGTRTYPISSMNISFDSVRHVTIQDLDDESWRPVNQVDYTTISDTLDDTPEAYDEPIRYARFNDNIVFDPNPDQAYTVRVQYRESLGDLISSGPGVPEEFHEIILLGGVHRAWLSKGNYNRSEAVMQRQLSLVSTIIEIPTKENIDYQSAAGKIIRTRYP